MRIIKLNVFVTKGFYLRFGVFAAFNTQLRQTFQNQKA